MSVAVIITCFNYSKYLTECIDSVFSQSYRDIELLVVDDGSTDDTVKVCRGLNVNYISIPNSGLARARNVGIRHCDSDLVMCLDADDTLTPISIECHKAVAGRGVIAQLGLQEFGGANQTRYGSSVTLKELLTHNSVFCNAVFHKSDWAAVGGFDVSETMRLGLEDWEFWIRLVAGGCVIRTLPVVGLNYRIHPASMTQTTTRVNYDEIVRYIRLKHKKLYMDHNL